MLLLLVAGCDSDNNNLQTASDGTTTSPPPETTTTARIEPHVDDACDTLAVVYDLSALAVTLPAGPDYSSASAAQALATAFGTSTPLPASLFNYDAVVFVRPDADLDTAAGDLRALAGTSDAVVEVLTAAQVLEDYEAAFGLGSRLMGLVDPAEIDAQLRIAASDPAVLAEMTDFVDSHGEVGSVASVVELQTLIDEFAGRRMGPILETTRATWESLAAGASPISTDAGALIDPQIASGADAEVLRPHADAVLDFAEHACGLVVE